MDKEITISLNGNKNKKDNKVTKTLNIETNLWEQFNDLCEKNDDINRTDCFNQLLKAGFKYLEEKETQAEKETYNYHNKLETAKQNIESTIKSFTGDFLETEYIVNNILELIKLSDFSSNNQHTRCKNILKKSIYVLFKFKENDFTIKDLYTLVVNPNGEGRMIVNKFLKLPARTELEQIKNIEVASFFLETFYEEKKDKNVYVEDIQLLSYYLYDLMEIIEIEDNN